MCMFNVRSLMCVSRTSSNIRKTGVLKNVHLPERALNVRLKKNNFNALIVIIGSCVIRMGAPVVL